MLLLLLLARRAAAVGAPSQNLTPPTTTTTLISLILRASDVRARVESSLESFLRFHAAFLPLGSFLHTGKNRHQHEERETIVRGPCPSDWVDVETHSKDTRDVSLALHGAILSRERATGRDERGLRFTQRRSKPNVGSESSRVDEFALDERERALTRWMAASTRLASVSVCGQGAVRSGT